MLKTSVNGLGSSCKRQKPLADSNGVDGLMGRFKSKYGGDVKRYYTNFDVAVEVSL